MQKNLSHIADQQRLCVTNEGRLVFDVRNDEVKGDFL